MKKKLIFTVASMVLVFFTLSGMAVFAQDRESQNNVLAGLKADKPWGKIVVDGAHELWQVKAATFIDVRTPSEYEQGHIPGAINIPLETLPDNVVKLPKDMDTLIVVYCKSGWRASIGMVTMRQLGYVNSKGFDGSWLAWIDASHPVKKGSKP
jgi:rhodanese-related sulfurtransferase